MDDTTVVETQPPVQTPWLSARAAAAYIGLRAKNSYKTMAWLAKQKKIVAGHTGKAFVFRPEDLDTFLLLRASKVRK